MNSDSDHDSHDHDEDVPSLAEEILRELNEPPVTPAPANRLDDKLPFDPARVSIRTLLRYGNEYRNHEPLLAQVMIELHSRDCTPHQAEVRALQRRWEYLVRVAQPARWPDSAIEREDRAFHGRCFQCGAQGMLAFFGYHVGRTRGLLMPVRHQILDYIYKGRLPTVTDEAYTRSWGQPCSPERLKRLSSMIAYLARNAQANENADYEEAISDWDADLRYLKSAYFRPAENPDHDWDWPMLHID
jgi:hypothetical protein